MSKMFQVYGIGQALIPVLPPPLPFASAPTSNQTNYEIGQLVYTPAHSPTAFYRDWETLDRKSTRLNSSHSAKSRMPSSA